MTELHTGIGQNQGIKRRRRNRRRCDRLGGSCLSWIGWSSRIGGSVCGRIHGRRTRRDCWRRSWRLAVCNIRQALHAIVDILCIHCMENDLRIFQSVITASALKTFSHGMAERIVRQERSKRFASCRTGGIHHTANLLFRCKAHDPDTRPSLCRVACECQNRLSRLNSQWRDSCCFRSRQRSENHRVSAGQRIMSGLRSATGCVTVMNVQRWGTLCRKGELGCVAHTTTNGSVTSRQRQNQADFVCTRGLTGTRNTTNARDQGGASPRACRERQKGSSGEASAYTLAQTAHRSRIDP
ncbi:hypothetical protein B932_0001 [Gluconobacter oxydans H24]|nr:hypothetical protein B932_0001 [Gluconobacter oxydans H24]